MADHTRLEELTLKRLLGEITPEEDNELESLAQASEENRQFINRMSPKVFHKRRRSLKRTDHDRLDRLTKQKIGNIPGVLEWVSTTAIERKFTPYSLGVAAGFLLILGAAWWFYSRSHTSETASLHPVEGTLRWQSASIALGQMDEGKAYDAGAILLARMGNQFFIIPGQDSAAATTAGLSYNFTVDGDQEMQVFFPDSSRMQLSPKSSISFQIYPRGTVIKEKQLVCNGEALFDIGHHYDMPTVIKTLKYEIRVLGTFFKVRDYKKEDTSAVFCYTGKVSVKDSDSTTKTIFASQRVTVDPRHELKVSTGDFPQAHWSSPELLFDFSNMNLDSAMNQIASWYGKSKVEYQGRIDKKTSGMVFTGKLSRYLTLQQLLSILERNDLHFTIQDRVILVAGSTDRPDHSH